jgi:hypothetical protein
MINSAHRSPEEDASLYTVHLHPETWWRRVVNVQVVEAVFPKTQPSINEFCNVLQFRERGRAHLTGSDLTVEDRERVHTVILPPGNYAAGDLLPLLGNGMIPREDGLHGSFKLRYNFEINPVSGAMTISTSPPAPYQTHEEAIDALGFTNTAEFLFGSGDMRDRSLHHILGFPHQDTGHFSTHVSARHINLSSSPFVDVAMERIPTNATKMTQRRDPFTGEMIPIRVLARIPLQVPNYQLQYYKPEPYDLLTTHFYPMSLPSVTIRLYDNRGNPYDTAGFDHYITLAFTYAVDSPKSALPGVPGPRRSAEPSGEPSGEQDESPEPPAPAEPKAAGPDPKTIAMAALGGTAAAYVIYRQFRPAAPPPLPGLGM